jgi:3-isopropylmalate/(R)-2-methylmalate dehydratase small subunit
MKPVRRVSGRVAVLDRADVDTDQIIPKQFLKRIERTGFGDFVFFDWRLDEAGKPRPEFELNRTAYAGASILLTGRNFGCGSSREHAAWALQEYGFEAIVAPSFGDIFHSNCLKIGLLPVELPADEVRALVDSVDPEAGAEMTVDLDACELTAPDRRVVPFEFDPFARRFLLEGLDEIGRTLAKEAEIAAFEARRSELYPSTTP